MAASASPTAPGHARWIIAYGCFLIAVGLAGYLSNPEKAITALVSGGTFGLISIGLGLAAAWGKSWARPATLGVTGFLSLIFFWRSTVSWMAALGEEPDKKLAAILISLMLLASVSLIVVLLRPRSA